MPAAPDEQVLQQLLAFLSNGEQMAGELAGLCKLLARIVLDNLPKEDRAAVRAAPHARITQLRQAITTAYNESPQARSYHDQIRLIVARRPPPGTRGQVTIIGPVPLPTQPYIIRQASDSSERAALRRLLDERLSMDEVLTLCYDLSIDSENLEGTTKVAKIRGLIGYLEHRGDLTPLRDWLRNHRPDIPLAE
jgi:hypothetical protein